MAFPSRRETYDSNTPSDLSSRTSMNGAQYHRSSKRTTIRSYQGSISNSSGHTTSTAASPRDPLFNNSEQNSGGAPSIYHPKSTHSREKATFRFSNQSQYTVGTIREAGSVSSYTATSSSKQTTRSLNTPSFEGEHEFPVPSTSRSSPYNLSTLSEPSPSSSRIYGVPPFTPFDDPSTKPYGDSPEPPQAALPTGSVRTHSRTYSYSSNHAYHHPPAQPSSNPGPPPTLYPSHSGSTAQRLRRPSSRAGSTSHIDPASIPNLPPPQVPLPNPSSYPFPLSHTQHEQQPKPKPMDTEQRDQHDGKPGLRTWWQHITTKQKSRPHASSENAHTRSKAQALAQEYVQPLPGAVFGRSFNDSLGYASVMILTVHATGLHVYSYIPVVMAKCGLFLKENATEIKGTFNVYGSNKRMRVLQAVFETPPWYGESLDWKKENYTVRDVAGIFRRYLTQLPKPVIPQDLHFPFRDAIAKKPYDQEMVITTYEGLISSMPRANLYLFLFILDLLSIFARKADKNLLTAQKLAVIFCPGLMSHPTHGLSPNERRLSQEVLEFLITHRDRFISYTSLPPALPSASSHSDMPPSTPGAISVIDEEGPEGWRIIDRHPRIMLSRGENRHGIDLII